MARPRVVEEVKVEGGPPALGEFLKFADNYACVDQDERGRARILWFLSEGNRIWIIETAWESEPERQSHMAYIRLLLEAHKTIGAYAHCLESWVMVRAPEAQAMAATDYEPMKFDALLIVAVSRAGESKQHGYLVHYDIDMKPQRREHANVGHGPMTGAIFELFDKEPVRDAAQ